jgi:hypothetical protein
MNPTIILNIKCNIKDASLSVSGTARIERRLQDHTLGRLALDVFHERTISNKWVVYEVASTADSAPVRRRIWIIYRADHLFEGINEATICSKKLGGDG